MNIHLNLLIRAATDVTVAPVINVGMDTATSLGVTFRADKASIFDYLAQQDWTGLFATKEVNYAGNHGDVSGSTIQVILKGWDIL